MNIESLIVLGLTGLPSSGKGEFSKVASNRGYCEVIMGDVIRDEIGKRQLELNRENSDRIMLQLREEHGDDVVAKITLKKIEDAIRDNHDKILIDGIRSMDEVEVFKKRFPELILVAIHADPETRYQRSKSRKREDDAYSRDSFKRRDQIELDVGIGDVIALSDILITPPDNLDQAQNIFNEVLNEISKPKEIGVVQDV